LFFFDIKLQPEDERDVQVTKSDQASINEFSNLTNKVATMEEEYKRDKEEKEYLDELIEELDLSEDTTKINVKIGDSFVEMSVDAARSKLQRDLAILTDKVLLTKAKIDKHNARMSELKASLYAKFGNTIHLEKD